MKKNGFVFIETIISIVVLAGALLLLYTSFTKILQSEKSNVYYDDISYIYRTMNIKNELEGTNLQSIISTLNNNSEKYYVNISLDDDNLFGSIDNKTYIANMFNDYNVSQIVVVKENRLNALKGCTKEASENSSYANYELCKNYYNSLSEDMITYLKNVYIDLPCAYIFAAKYTSCNNTNTICRSYFSWVSV